LILIVYLWDSRKDRALEESIPLAGNIELREVEIAFKIAGRLIELNAEEGDLVREGALLARLDPEPILSEREKAQAQLESLFSRRLELEALIRFQEASVAAQIDQKRAELSQAEIALRELLAGARSQEIEEAAAAVGRARAEFERARSDWDRAQTLYQNEDISTAQFQQFKSAYEAGQASLLQAEERSKLVQEGPRKETIEAAGAGVDRARAGLQQALALRLDIRRNEKAIQTLAAEIEAARAQVRLMDSHVGDASAYSPIAGMILVKSSENGEVVVPGAPIVTIGDLAHPWIRGYIEEPDLGRVKVGDRVEVTTDSYPEKVYPGRVSFIASEAEFTPKQIQTRRERTRLVYRIKVDVANPDQELKLNMPVDARIVLGRTSAEGAGSVETR
jgi:HlyD family secretion protein